MKFVIFLYGLYMRFIEGSDAFKSISVFMTEEFTKNVLRGKCFEFFENFKRRCTDGFVFFFKKKKCKRQKIKQKQKIFEEKNVVSRGRKKDLFYHLDFSPD